MSTRNSAQIDLLGATETDAQPEPAERRSGVLRVPGTLAPSRREPTAPAHAPSRAPAPGAAPQAMTSDILVDLHLPGEAAERAGRRSPSVWDPDITRRMRALLHALPLFRLHHSNEIVGGRGGEFAHYDAFALAFRIFDLVIENTGLESEPETDDLAALLAPTLTAMDEAEGIAPDPDRHRRMAERVLSWLLNATGHGEPYPVEYTDFDRGEAKRRKLDVELLRERYMPGGRIVPRLSPEITNLYLSALDLPIEDQQIAVEAVMSAQLKRGSFNEALRSARQAHALSVRYREQVETILRETRRDAVAVDWREEVPTLLDSARQHIEERQRTERQIRQGAEDKLNALEMGSQDARSLAAVIDLVDRCFDQHGALLRRLIQALPTFLDEQARQAFVPQYARSAPDLPKDVLEPFMGLPQAVALEATGFLLGQFVPPNTPGVLSLLDLVEWHFRPRTEARSHSVEVAEREMEDLPEEPLVFAPEDWDRASTILDGISEPERLSELLGRLQGEGAPEIVLELLVLRALFAFSPNEESTGPEALRAEKAGGTLTWGRYHGDDLFLFRIPESEVS